MSGVIGWLLHGPGAPRAALAEPERLAPIIAAELPSAPPVSPITVLPVATPAPTQTADREVALRHPVSAAPVSAPVSAPISEEQQLIDRAYSGSVKGKVLSVLDALAEHARRFPSHTAVRSKILARACSRPEARGVAPCVE